MGLLDGLKRIGNGISNFTNDIKICKTHFLSFSDEELMDMLRVGRFDKGELEYNYDHKFNHTKCELAVKMVLKDRGYSQEYINSIAR